MVALPRTFPGGKAIKKYLGPWSRLHADAHHLCVNYALLSSLSLSDLKLIHAIFFSFLPFFHSIHSFIEHYMPGSELSLGAIKTEDRS